MAVSIAWILSKLRFPLAVSLGGTGHDGTLTTLASNTNWDTIINPGEYLVPASSGPSGPVSGINWLVKVTNTSLGIKQEATPYGAIGKFSRAVVNGAWSVWYKSYDNTSIVGTVSQASGVPTGAIIESGSNANGYYVKYADGTLICRHISSTSVTTNQGTSPANFSAGVPFTFPVPFTAVPAIGTSALSPNGYFAWIASEGAASATSVVFRLVSFNSNANAYISYVAVGRWF